MVDGQKTRTYAEVLEEARAYLPPDLWLELDLAVGAKMLDEQRWVLDHLVIAINYEGFPGLDQAISTAGCRPYHIEECEHHVYAQLAGTFRELGSPAQAHRFEHLARVLLEDRLSGTAPAPA